jgi:amidase
VNIINFIKDTRLLLMTKLTFASVHELAQMIRDQDRNVPYSMASGAYVVPFNLTGHPVVVIPIGQTQKGLPIGMQIIGQRWREMELLAIAQELDKAIGIFQHPAGY